MDNKVAHVKYPELFFNILEMDKDYPGGESPREFFIKDRKYIQKPFNSHGRGQGEGERHGSYPWWSHRYYLLLIEGRQWTNKSPKIVKADPTGIHIIKYDNDGWKAVTSNITDHLNPVSELQ